MSLRKHRHQSRLKRIRNQAAKLAGTTEECFELSHVKIKANKAKYFGVERWKPIRVYSVT